MKNYNFTTLVGYERKTNDKIKKILGILFLSAFFLYLILTGGIAEIIFCAVSVFMMFGFFIIRNLGNKPAKMLANLTKKKGIHFFDVLPIKFEFNNEENNCVNIIIEKAEYFKKKVWNKKYTFVPENIKAINYFEEDDNLILTYETGSLIHTTGDNTETKKEELKKSFLTFYLDKEKREELINSFKENGFAVKVIKEDVKEEVAEEKQDKEIIEEKKEKITEENNDI